MTLLNQTALIFGGSSGIGRATALRLAADGATVAVVASGNLAKAQGVVDEIVAAGGKGRAYTADVTDVSSIRDVVTAVERDLGGPHMLVYSAGVYYPTEIGSTGEDDYDRMADINLKGAYFAVDAVTPGMKQRRDGRIVLIASVAGLRGSSAYPLYAATKAAIIMLCKSLVGKLAPHGIQINAVAPGNTATPLNENDRTGENSEKVLAAKAAVTPSGRTYSPPEDIAAAVHFLISGDMKAIHGTTLLVDEGLYAGF